MDACIVGVPVDTATSNRPGTRFGPREIRTESVMVRPRSHWTGENPFDRIQIADIGDVVANLYNVEVACDNITSQYEYVKSENINFTTIVKLNQCENKNYYIVSRKLRVSKF